MTSLDPLRGTPAWGAGERCGTTKGWHDHANAGEPQCAPCRRAHAEWKAGYRKRVYLARGPLMVDGTGSQRRLRALIRMGWPTGLLGPELGTTPSAVTKFMRGRPMRPETAEKIAVLYDRLWDKPGPSKVAQAYAVKQGWPPPLAYDDDTIDDPKARPHGLGSWSPPSFDEIAVQRAMRGDLSVRLMPRERAEVVRRLKSFGLSDGQVSERLGIARRSVERIKRKAS